MLRRMKALSAAIIAAGSVISSGAFAIAITDVPTLDLWISGSSTQDVLLAGLIPALCDDTPITFTDTAGQAGVGYSAYFCTMSSAKIVGFAGPQKVMVHKRSAGGSAFGVAPVALAGVAGQTPAVVNVGQMEISFTTGGTVSGNNCKLDVGTRYVCNPANQVSKISDAGISDVEPGLFTGPNLIPIGSDYGTVAGGAGTFALTFSQLGKLKASPMSAVTYGVVVTKDLRDAMQKAQGKIVGSDAIADMPSLTSTQIRSLFSGAVTDWSQFTVFDTASSSWKTLDQLTSSSLASTVVNVCRGNPGSGTQAVFNAHFLHTPCASGGMLPAVDNTPSSRHSAYLPAGALPGKTSIDAFDAAINDVGPPGIPVVNEVSTSSDLTACLRDLENGKTSVANGKVWGIGYQSILMSDPAFRFVAIDGVTPSWNNVAASNYFFWGVNSMQYLKAADAGALAAPLAGNKKLIVDTLITNASSPSQLNALVNKANANISGPIKLGAMALSTSGFLPSTPYSATNPVLPVSTKGIDLQSQVNTCRPAVLDNSGTLEMISAGSNL